MLNTKVTYMYRDASNYKFWGTFILLGQFDLSDVESHLFDGEFSIPHEVGLEHLLNIPMNQDDHYLHTIQEVERCEDINVVCSSSEMIERFREASEKGWFSSFRF